MQILNVNINQVKPYERNPRINKDAVDKVAESIKQFGFKQPVVVDKDYIIVCGHTRYKASKKLKLKEIPIVVASDLTEEQVKAYRLADNKTAEYALWDNAMLEDELKSICDFDMSSFGFDIDLAETKQSDFIEDEVPEAPAEPKAKQGDIYQLGNHRLMCGDSTKKEDVKRLMNNQLANLIVTDPPYNVDYEGSNGLKIQNDKQSDNEFLNFLTSAFEAADEHLQEGAAYYIFFADVETYNFVAAVKNVGWKFTQMCVWVKNSLVLGRKDYHFKHEPILYGWKEGKAHNWYSDRKQSTVLEFDKPQKNDVHPTMKPINLITYLIQNSSKKKDIVLDLFGGSGSTLIACEQTQRISYTMEYDPKYVDVIIERWENITGNKAIKCD